MHIQNKGTCGFVCMCVCVFSFSSTLFPMCKCNDSFNCSIWHPPLRASKILISSCEPLGHVVFTWFACFVFKQKHKLLPLPCASTNKLLVQEAAYDPHFKDEEAPNFPEKCTFFATRELQGSHSVVRLIVEFGKTTWHAMTQNQRLHFQLAFLYLVSKLHFEQW